MAIEPKLDCYAILEISSDAEDAAIRTAFAAQLRKFRSAQFFGAAGQQKLSDLRSAYHVLIDPVQRRRYDLQRRISAMAAACAQKPSADDDAPRQDYPAPGTRPVSATRLGRYRVPLLLALIVVALTAVGIFYAQPRPERPAARPSAPPVAIDDHAAVKTRVAPVADDLPTVPPVYSAARPGAPPPQDVKPVGSKPVGSKLASSNRRASGPATAPAEACGDVVAVLGLCKPKSTVEKQ